MSSRRTAALRTEAVPDDTVDAPPVPVRARHDGWTVERQRKFLTALAETGSVTSAAAECGLSARSAYRLRARADARVFAAGWDEALRIATGRLTAIAFERAVNGRVRQLWKEGELVATTREPSDRLLMYLLDTLHHRGYAGSAAEQRDNVAARSSTRLPGILDKLGDSDCPAEFITSEDIAGAVLLPPETGAEPEDVQ